MKRTLLVTILMLGSLGAGRAADQRASGEIGKLTLERAVKIALKQNPDILRALHEIDRTRGQVVEVRARALPRVSVAASYKQQDGALIERSGGGFTNDGSGTTTDFSSLFGGGSAGDKYWQVTLQVQQTLYSGGQVRAALKVAKFTEDQTFFMLRDVVDRVVATVRSEFYAVLLNRKLITVAEESIRLLKDELKDQRNRFAAGTVPRFNVLRAEVAVANAQPDLIRARNNLIIAELQLAKSLGLGASNDPGGRPLFEVVGELRASGRRIGLQQALEMARQRRPFLKAQKLTILVDEQRITVAAAGNKPQLGANGGWEVRNSRLTDDLSKEVNGWYFGVNGSWNVWDGNETRGLVAQAKARLASSRVNYSDSVQQVELEVQKAFAQLQEARQLIASQGKVVEQADEALRLARERLAAGAGTQLDVLDADVARTKAKTTQQQALYAYNVGLAEFDRAVGADTVYDDTFSVPQAQVAEPRLPDDGGKRPGE